MRIFSIMETAFENFDNSIRLYLSKSFGELGLNYTNSQIFGSIFTALKGISQNIMFYIEDAMTEQNIYTALRKKSVYSLAKISGYEPFYGSSSSGTLLGKVILNNGLDSTSSKIYIKNNSTIQNQNTAINYTLSLATDYYVIDLTKPLVTHEFKIIQGFWQNSLYTAKGYLLESIHIDTYGNYDKDSLKVIVNGKEYTRAYNLYDMTNDSLEYLVSIGYDNTFDITFGDGNHGKALEEGDNINIRYIVHRGNEGNVSTMASSEWIFVSKGTDSKGNDIDLNNFITLEMNNSISGGMDCDKISTVKEMIGYNSRSLVLVNEDNFKLFFKRFSFIGYSNIWSAENSLTICASCLSNFNDKIEKNTDYFDLNKDELLISDYHKEIIIDTLENSKKTFAGLTLKFIDPIIRRYAIICYIKINDKFNKEQAKDNIKESLAKFFLNVNMNTKFISKAEVIKNLLESDSNIKSIDITFIPEVNEISYVNGYYNNYEWKFKNGEYQYIPKKIFYETNQTHGLDEYGNIQLDCNMEMILLQGGFKYYIDKEGKTKNIKDYVDIPTIQYFFI